MEHFSFSWINGTCQTDLLRKFNVQQEFLPNLVVYIPISGIYASLIGTFEESNIIKFIEDFSKGKVPTSNTTLTDADFKKVNCEKVQEEKNRSRG